jgi:hypothetical protein
MLLWQSDIYKIEIGQYGYNRIMQEPMFQLMMNNLL